MHHGSVCVSSTHSSRVFRCQQCCACRSSQGRAAQPSLAGHTAACKQSLFARFLHDKTSHQHRPYEAHMSMCYNDVGSAIPSRPHLTACCAVLGCCLPTVQIHQPTAPHSMTAMKHHHTVLMSLCLWCIVAVALWGAPRHVLAALPRSLGRGALAVPAGQGGGH